MKLFNTLSDATIDDVNSRCSALGASSPYQRKTPLRIDQNMYRTLEDVAAELGVSNQMVGKIQQNAIKKCLIWCNRHGYRLEDLLG